MDLVERCERAIANNTESAGVRGWRLAVAAANRGDGAATAQALSVLAEKPRFIATLVIGLASPSVLVETAATYDAAVAEGTRAIDWQDCCEHRLVQRWAVAARDLEPRVLGRLVNRAYYGAAGVAALVAIRARIHADDLDVARKLYATIPELAKQERGAACAAIGVAMQSTEWMLDAIAAAQQAPIIESGGEESEALAAVLAELAQLPAAHRAVVACVDALRRWGATYVEKDARSYGVAAAVQTCVRAGWLDHARALVAVVWSDGLRARCEQAIASGAADPPPVYELEEPAFADITAQKYPDERLRVASARALTRLDANDRDGAFAAVLAGIEAEAGASTASTTERVAWARALADGGKRDEAIAVLTALLPAGLPPEGYALAMDVLGTDARPFVEAALANKLELVKFSMGLHDTYVATDLARLVVRTNDAELERTLIAAVATIRRNEDSRPSYPWQERNQRITETLRELAGAYPELDGATPATERLDAWLDALGEANRVHLGAAAGALASESLDAIATRVGGELSPDHVAALAAELAKRNRLADALALVAKHEPGVQQKALVAMARVATAPADRKKLVATSKKCKKTGRDRDAQGVWKFNLATVMLAADDFDGAIEVVAGMQDCRISGYQPGELARAIAKRLDESPTERWTAERAGALAEVVGGPAVIPQDVGRALFAVIPPVIVHQRDVAERALSRIRSKFRQPADAALVDAVAAAGHATADNTAHAVELLTAALDRAAAGGAFYADASDFVWCVSKLPIASEHREGLWLKAFALLRTQAPAKAMHVVTNIFHDLAPADAPLVARAIDSANLPSEIAEHARDRLGELVATALDDAALLPLEAAVDPPAARRRVQQAARHLARRGQHADAARLAKLAGLAS